MSRRIASDAEKERRKRLLDRAKTAYGAYRKSKDEALVRARIAAEQEVAERRAHAAQLALEAVQGGVSLRQIGREVMRTSDYATVRRLIGEVDVRIVREQAEEAELTPFPGIDVVQLAGTRYRVTLSAAELEGATSRADWGARPVPEQYMSAEVDYVGDRFVPQEDAWIDELDEQHPVVVWLALPSSQRKITEIVEAMK